MVILNTLCRPRVSESGTKSIGPEAKPRRKVVIPRVARVEVQENAVVTLGMAAVWMLEVSVTQVVIRTMVTVAHHLRGEGQVVGVSERRSTICG
jgi:hypothetical protein